MEEIIKMNNVIKKAVAALAAVALAVSSITYNPASVKAESVTLLDKEDVAIAGTDIEQEFVTENSGLLYIVLMVQQMVGGTIEIYEDGKSVGSDILGEETWTPARELGYDVDGYIYGLKIDDIVQAQWKVIMNFNTDTEYVLLASQEKEAQKAFLSQNAITLAKGFSEKLSVSGATGNIVWASSNNKIATVDSTGKVKAKKAGSAKITATTEDGQVLTCMVSVQKNEYNARRAYASEVTSGKCTMQVYKMSYDSKGNLVLKAVVLNNKAGYKTVGINKLTIKVKDAYGKAIGTFKVKNKKVSAEAGSSSKPLKFVIKKSALKNKKADLRTAKCETSGEAEFIRTGY